MYETNQGSIPIKTNYDFFHIFIKIKAHKSTFLTNEKMKRYFLFPVKDDRVQRTTEIKFFSGHQTFNQKQS